MMSQYCTLTMSILIMVSGDLSCEYNTCNGFIDSCVLTNHKLVAMKYSSR
jgi:hypothetical protein